jgi:tRNA(Arg) A34 adenosine deaminase TadA
MSSEAKKKYMQQAIDLSRQHMQGGHGGPFGAIVVKGGKVIGEGWNKVTSTNDPTAHAEVEAIRQACKHLSTYELKGCEIFTSCEPCPMCLSAIYWARIDKIYYANSKADAAQIQFDDDFIYQEIPKSLKDRAIPVERLLATEALEVFKEWEAKADKVRY